MRNESYISVTSGIGGIHAGGLEAGVVHRESVNDISIKVKIHNWLVENHLSDALEDGYIINFGSHSLVDMHDIDQFNKDRREKLRIISSAILDNRKYLIKISPEYLLVGINKKNYKQLAQACIDQPAYAQSKEALSVIDMLNSLQIKYNACDKLQTYTTSYRLSDYGYKTYKQQFKLELTPNYIEPAYEY